MKFEDGQMKEYQRPDMDLEEHNLAEIEGLSQRGKTLSIVEFQAPVRRLRRYQARLSKRLQIKNAFFTSKGARRPGGSV